MCNRPYLLERDVDFGGGYFADKVFDEVYRWYDIGGL